MLATPPHVKRYKSAEKRFLKSVIKQFFLKEFPKYFGPKIAEKIAQEIIDIFQKLNPDTSKIQPGQILWNALDKNTPASSAKAKFVPVILTLVNQDDIEKYVRGDKVSDITKYAFARMIREAYDQGGILSMRDLGLLTLRNVSWVCQTRIEYEKEHQVILPHAGALHDMGSCLTHKEQIIYKVIVEKKDPTVVATQTNHSQRAVDRYLQNYHRVITVYKDNNDVNYIHFITKIAKNVIYQYINIYDLYVKPSNS